MPTLTVTVRRWFGQPARAVDLAVLRVVVFLLLATTVWTTKPWRYARVGDALVTPTDVLGGVIVDLPRSHAALVVGSVLTIGLALVAACGRAVGLAGGAAVVLAVWVLGVTQSFGKVDHFHHVLWLAAIVAVGRNAPGIALRVSWLLVGCCYLFPGLAKAAVGADWFSGRRLEAIQQTTIIEKSFTPLFELHGPVAATAATATVLFEIGFLFVVLTRYRRWAFATAIGFHLSTSVLMHIDFASMILVLLALAYGAGERARADDGTGPPAVPRGLVVVATPLLAAVVLTGAGGLVNGWPVAEYPPFDYVPADTFHTIVAMVDGAGGCRLVELHRHLDIVTVSNRPAIIANVLNHPTADRFAALADLVPRQPDEYVIGFVHRELDLHGTTVAESPLDGRTDCA